jgi:CRP/FNR family transcriptional regulator, cyclic AMP receptor protein
MPATGHPGPRQVVVMIDVNVLRELDLFRGLEGLHLAHLGSIARQEGHAKGTVLFEEGDTGSALYVVVEGSVRISKMVPGIGEEALAILRPGSYFGEMEFIDRGLTRAARALVHERAALYAFGYAELDDLFGADRDLALAIQHSMLQTLARRLRATNDKVTAMFAMAQFG